MLMAMMIMVVTAMIVTVMMVVLIMMWFKHILFYHTLNMDLNMDWAMQKMRKRSFLFMDVIMVMKGIIIDAGDDVHGYGAEMDKVTRVSEKHFSSHLWFHHICVLVASAFMEFYYKCQGCLYLYVACITKAEEKRGFLITFVCYCIIEFMGVFT